MSDTSAGARVAARLARPGPDEFSTGLGGPLSVSYPQDGPRSPQAGPSESEPVVSRETDARSPRDTGTRARPPADLAATRRTPFDDDSHPAGAGGRAHRAGPPGRAGCGRPWPAPDATRVRRGRQPEGRGRQDHDHGQRRRRAGPARPAGAGHRPRPAGQRLHGARRRAPPRRRRRPTTRWSRASPLAEVVTAVPGRARACRGARRRSTWPAPRSSWSAWWPARAGCARRSRPPAGRHRRRGGRGPVRLRLHRLPAVAGAAHAQRAGRRRRRC